MQTLLRLKLPNTHTCVNHRAWTAIVSHVMCNMTLNNIRLDSAIVDENFVSGKQCVPPFTSDFYTSTSSCIRATAKITLSQPPAIILIVKSHKISHQNHTHLTVFVFFQSVILVKIYWKTFRSFSRFFISYFDRRSHIYDAMHK